MTTSHSRIDDGREHAEPTANELREQYDAQRRRDERRQKWDSGTSSPFKGWNSGEER